MNDFYQMMGVCIAVCSIAGGYFQLICRPQLAEITELKNEQHQLIQTYQQALNQARDLRVVYQTAEKRRFDLKLYKSLYFYSKQNVTSAIRSLFRTKQIRIVALQDRDKDAQTALQAMRYKVFFAMNQLALKTTIDHLSRSSLPIFIDSINCQHATANYVCRAHLTAFSAHSQENA